MIRSVGITDVLRGTILRLIISRMLWSPEGEPLAPVPQCRGQLLLQHVEGGVLGQPQHVEARGGGGQEVAPRVPVLPPAAAAPTATATAAAAAATTAATTASPAAATAAPAATTTAAPAPPAAAAAHAAAAGGLSHSGRPHHREDLHTFHALQRRKGRPRSHSLPRVRLFNMSIRHLIRYPQQSQFTDAPLPLGSRYEHDITQCGEVI